MMRCRVKKFCIKNFLNRCFFEKEFTRSSRWRRQGEVIKGADLQTRRRPTIHEGKKKELHLGWKFSTRPWGSMTHRQQFTSCWTYSNADVLRKSWRSDWISLIHLYISRCMYRSHKRWAFFLRGKKIAAPLAGKTMSFVKHFHYSKGFESKILFDPIRKADTWINPEMWFCMRTFSFSISCFFPFPFKATWSCQNFYSFSSLLFSSHSFPIFNKSKKTKLYFFLHNVMPWKF